MEDVETVYAELSGGLDSSSVVCMATDIRRRAGGAAIHPVFYEMPGSSNELLYLEAVERHCGLTAYRLVEGTFSLFSYEGATVVQEPHAAPGRAIAVERLIAPDKVLLTGTGGDAVAWSLYEPHLDLADLFAQGRVLSFLNAARRHHRQEYRTFWSLVWRDGLLAATRSQSWRDRQRAANRWLNWPVLLEAISSAPSHSESIERTAAHFEKAPPSVQYAWSVVEAVCQLVSSNMHGTCTSLEATHRGWIADSWSSC